jgi:hypothetical protein
MEQGDYLGNIVYYTPPKERPCERASGVELMAAWIIGIVGLWAVALTVGKAAWDVIQSAICGKWVIL